MKIALVAPTKPCQEEVLNNFFKFMDKHQISFVYNEQIFNEWGYLAGSDQLRAQSIMEAFEDLDVKGIWALDGGYGSARLLPYLDLQTIKNNPKPFIGFSDITALQSYFCTISPMECIHAPNVAAFFREPYESNREVLVLDVLQRLTKNNKVFTLEDCKIINPGRAQGNLIGGNLCVLTSLIGTQYFPNLEGKILVLEDINEPTYKIDRMLLQLKLSGAFEKVSGVLFGHFTNCQPSKNSLELESILLEPLSSRDIPIVMNFPVGHIRQTKALVFNRLSKLMTQKKVFIN